MCGSFSTKPSAPSQPNRNSKEVPDANQAAIDMERAYRELKDKAHQGSEDKMDESISDESNLLKSVLKQMNESSVAHAKRAHDFDQEFRAGKD